MESPATDHRSLWIVFLLIFATVVVYWPVGGYPFITLDDEQYITRNPDVLQGLTAGALRWAFTTFHAANWHPIAWISHMADVEFFGVDAGWHHRVNVLLHIANTVALYWVLRGMTGAVWRSAFVAALFAVHPLHVESVAWVAERKDLLCAFFWLLAVRAYWGYATRGGRIRYIAVTAFFLLGLMSKPMVVTLPFVFLLLDYWPLQRVAGTPSGYGTPFPGPGIPLRRLAAEKGPWFLLSLGSCVVTFLAQRQGGAVGTIAEMAPGIRIGNAAVSYGAYLWNVFSPFSLAVFYPHPAGKSAGLPWSQVAAAVTALSAISASAWRWRRNRPYFIVGWLFYLGTLVPVIGLVQVGMQAMADRYMYLPLVGVSVIVSWGAYDLTRKFSRRNRILGIGGGALLVVLSVTASLQVSRWRDSVTLYRHALTVTSENWAVYFHLAGALLDAGDADEAIRYLEEGLRHQPDDLARINLGRALGVKGRYEEAAGQFLGILERHPGDSLALLNLGVALERLGRDEEALACMRRVVTLRPDFVDGYTNLGGLLLKMGRREEAIVHLRRALRLNPDDVEGRRLLQAALGKSGT